MRSCIASSVLAGLASAAVVPAVEPRTYGHGHQKLNVQVGDRPYFLIDAMDEGPLKQKLQSCSERDFKTSDFVFSHRGAPLQFPEPTLQSYKAARRQGSGAIECDVAFTKDKQLVCRHPPRAMRSAHYEHPQHHASTQMHHAILTIRQ
jgi:glycerophosphoryl diester phosphodiesterase